MERIQSREVVCVVSTLVLLEVIEVIRKRIVEYASYGELDTKRQQEIREVAEAKCRKFIDDITKLASQKKVLLLNPNRILSSYLEDTLSYLRNYFGRIEDNRDFPPKFRYRGLGHYDIQHAINARDCSARELISFDRACSELGKLGGFHTLRISVPI